MSLGVGLQGAIFGLAPLVLIVAITARAGGQDESYLTWAVFAALIIAGCLTALQASRIWRLGAGHILIMGATPNFVAISVLALTAGGPPLLASLIVVSSLAYLALALWLPLLRRIITPVGFGHGPDADRRFSPAGRAGPGAGNSRGSARGRGSGRRCGHAGNDRGARDASVRRLAALVAHHRDRDRVHCGGIVRGIRSPAGDRCLLVRRLRRRVWGIRPDPRRKLLGATAGVRCSDARRRHQEHRRQRRDSAGIETQAARDRLSAGAEFAQDELAGNPHVRHCRDAANDRLLLVQRVPGQPDRGRRA